MIVFVHGCFWHQHPGCKYARTPRCNRSYWVPKLTRNVERDLTARRELEAHGWTVLVIWECEARNEARWEQISPRIAAA